MEIALTRQKLVKSMFNVFHGLNVHNIPIIKEYSGFLEF